MQVVVRKALITILLFGIVSLFADIVYEGARSIIPGYLGLLGASAAIVGFIAGFGELLGFALRMPFGYLADITRSYWLLTFMGYTVNLFAVPLLALTTDWKYAALLIFFERLGKAIRTPARDVVLSTATKAIGRGKGFAIHEVLDQVGAITGPAIVLTSMALTSSYRFTFGLLAVPAIISLIALYLTYKLYPKPLESDETSQKTLQESSSIFGLGVKFWLYMISISLSTMGFMHAALILYRARDFHVLPEELIPSLYLIAMAVDAVFALILGFMYDKYGLKVIGISYPLTILIPLFALNPTYYGIILSSIFFGIVMAFQETLMRAGVADLTPVKVRGSAYGIFNAVYGVSLFISGTVMGLLYERFMLIIFYSMILQILALIVLIRLIRLTSIKQA